MFAKIAVLSTLAVIASAAPTGSVSQCNTGSAQCCNSLQSSEGPGAAALYGLLGVVLQDVTAQIGFGCTPISVIALSQGTNCAQQPVCCQNNQFNGLVNVGCTPISL